MSMFVARQTRGRYVKFVRPSLALWLGFGVWAAAGSACDDDGAGSSLDAAMGTGGAGGATSLPDGGQGDLDQDANVDGGPVGACNAVTTDPDLDDAIHVAECQPITWRTNPPSSGKHYPVWPVFRAYDKPVPWGYLVHALEHGAVVIAYNCPEGCADEVQAAKAVIADSPPKASCSPPVPPVVLVPDPNLPVRFAASAWGHVLRASCFDRAAFAAFIVAHENQGPEGISGDCGYVDEPAAGWCH